LIEKNTHHVLFAYGNMSNCYSTRSIEFDEKSSCTMSRRNLTSRVQRLFNLDQCIHDKATIWKQKKIYIHHKATKRGAAAGPKNCVVK